MGRPLEPKKIKSAHRVLEVLEYFNIHRGEATVMGIARAMNYPQSSTSELLGCLVALGYLHHDRYTRTYRPSARVPLLGAWVQPKLFRQGHLLPMMDELVEESNAHVVLGSKIGTAVQYIHVVGAQDAMQGTPVEGTTASLLHSAMGKILLSTYDRANARKLIHRLNAEIEDSARRISIDAFAAELDAVRARGYAVNYNELDGAMVSVLLPRTSTQTTADEQIALGIFAPNTIVEENEESFVRMLRGAVARHLGPLRVATNPPPGVQHKELARRVVG
jgi:DNA-binding IclR family transcriptional regulator